MNSNTFTRGDILRARLRDIRRGYHYIIYYSGYDDSSFLGGMITHSASNLNTPMIENHFVQNDENGVAYQIRFDNSHLVIAKLIKPEFWGYFTKVGQLSNDGIEFFENTIANLDEETFSEYFKRTR